MCRVPVVTSLQQVHQKQEVIRHWSRGWHKVLCFSWFFICLTFFDIFCTMATYHSYHFTFDQLCDLTLFFLQGEHLSSPEDTRLHTPSTVAANCQLCDARLLGNLFWVTGMKTRSTSCSDQSLLLLPRECCCQFVACITHPPALCKLLRKWLHVLISSFTFMLF